MCLTAAVLLLALGSALALGAAGARAAGGPLVPGSANDPIAHADTGAKRARGHKHHTHRKHHKRHKRHRRTPTHRRGQTKTSCPATATRVHRNRRRHRRERCSTRRTRHKSKPTTGGGASGKPPASSPPTAAPTSAPVAPAPSPTPAPPGDPLAGDHFYVYPSDSAVTEYKALLAQGQTSEAQQIWEIASQPEAVWLTSDGSSSMVPGIMSGAAAGGATPVLVVYDIPGRDCGSYSSGGASGAGDYESFIDSVASGLGQGKAVVIVEPDALSDLSCLPAGDAQLIGYAVSRLDADANAQVYVDAGNPGWRSAASEASALQQAVGSARAGFAVDVSNFYPTAADVAYGTAIAAQAGGRHFVIDTSRNGGNVAGGQWCNPPGAGIGADPTTSTGNPLVDALLWIKDVGESDGTCNGGPSAGQFWLSYALDLVADG